MTPQVFLIAFLVFGGVILGMSVGVLFGRRCLKGSCGGLSAWRDELGRPMCEACAECPEKKHECELEEAEVSPSGPSASTSSSATPDAATSGAATSGVATSGVATSGVATSSVATGGGSSSGPVAPGVSSHAGVDGTGTTREG